MGVKRINEITFRLQSDKKKLVVTLYDEFGYSSSNFLNKGDIVRVINKLKEYYGKLK